MEIWNSARCAALYRWEFWIFNAVGESMCHGRDRFYLISSLHAWIMETSGKSALCCVWVADLIKFDFISFAGSKYFHTNWNEFVILLKIYRGFYWIFRSILHEMAGIQMYQYFWFCCSNNSYCRQSISSSTCTRFDHINTLIVIILLFTRIFLSLLLVYNNTIILQVTTQPNLYW